MFALLGFAFYLMYLLYHFASNMMIALKEDDEHLTLVAIESLIKHYTLYGILMLVYMGLFGIVYYKKICLTQESKTRHAAHYIQ